MLGISDDAVPWVWMGEEVRWRFAAAASIVVRGQSTFQWQHEEFCAWGDVDFGSKLSANQRQKDGNVQ